MEYAPPVWQEGLRAVALLAGGGACLRLGLGVAGRRGRAWIPMTAAGALYSAVVGGLANFVGLPDALGLLPRLIGGGGALACLGALVLLGITAGAAARGGDRRQPVRGTILAVTTVLLLLVLAVQGGSGLAWRCFGQAMRANYPDPARGFIQQTSGVTCGPAAAALLLHHGGVNNGVANVRISEGEMAQLARTTLGTEPFALGLGVDRVARRHGWRARIARLGYEQAVRLNRPFIAYVLRPGVGGHVILARQLSRTAVQTLDPLSGDEDTLSADEFRRQWFAVAIWVEPDAARSFR